MMLTLIISCGGLKLHGDWSPFGLYVLASKVTQEGFWNIFPCCMLTPLDPIFGPAISFALTRVLESSRYFLTSSKTEALVQMFLKFKMSSHFCCCQNWSNQF